MCGIVGYWDNRGADVSGVAGGKPEMMVLAF